MRGMKPNRAKKWFLCRNGVFDKRDHTVHNDPGVISIQVFKLPLFNFRALGSDPRFLRIVEGETDDGGVQALDMAIEFADSQLAP